MIKKRSLAVALGVLLTGSLFANDESMAACPTLYMSGTDVSCYGQINGTAQVSISNGSGDYTVNWSNGMNSTSLIGLSVGTYTVSVKDNVSGCSVIGAFVVGSPDPIAVTETITDVNCFADNTGDIAISVVGGTGTKTYNWKNSLGGTVSTSEDLWNVVADDYSLYIIDVNGCTFNKTYAITEPAEAVNSSALTTDATCFSSATGTINVDVWGGTPSYTYAWSSGQGTQDVSNLTAGSYTLTITDFKGCTRVQVYNINEPVVLGGSFSPSDVLCYGDATGSAAFTPTGGTLPYSYSWQNSATLFAESSNVLNNIIADNYQLTVTDAKGCLYVGTTTVNEPSELTASATSVDVSCFGGNDGSINLTVLGGTVPYAYEWTDGLGSILSTSQDLSNLFADQYTVNITDNNDCGLMLSRMITQPDLPITVTETITDVLCYGNNTGAIDLDIIGGTPPFEVTWTSGQIAEDVANLLAGTYGYTVVDAMGCINTNSMLVDQPAQSLTVTNVITDVNCYGESNGAIDLTVTGGTAPYVYIWSNSSYELSVTSQDIVDYPTDGYRFEVTDAHDCKYIDTLTISEPPQLVSSVVGVDILCKGGNNGSVDLTVNGGVLPYLYNWNNGPITEDQNTLIAGYYEVLITDDHNCTLMDSVTLTEPLDSLEFTFEVEDVLCNDGTDGAIDLFITGGTIPYNYLWSNGDTLSEVENLTAGFYEFNPVQAGCQECDLAKG